MGELRWGFSALLAWWKGKVEKSPFFILSVLKPLYTFPFLQKIKGFINYVFCRNWAVRNPAGTRLDSLALLINKLLHLLMIPAPHHTWFKIVHLHLYLPSEPVDNTFTWRIHLHLRLTPAALSHTCSSTCPPVQEHHLLDEAASGHSLHPWHLLLPLQLHPDPAGQGDPPSHHVAPLFQK